MKNKSYIFLFALIFMIVFSISAVSADDLQTTDSGEVSGDVDVVTVNPWTTSSELIYDIPAEAKDIKSADVYVNVYSGSASNTYGAIANVSLKTVNGENQIASEVLWIENGTTDGTVYPVNNHTDKCYSDYQMRYDITNSLKGLNGSSISIKVDTFKLEDKLFDGKIKLIALVLAYDDGDDDIIYYWIDSNQKWTKTNITTTFDTANIEGIYGAELTNVALSSANGNYTLNDDALGAPDIYSSGNYYQYSYWDVYDEIDEGEDTVIYSTPGSGSSYASLKNVLTVLKVTSIIADFSFNTEYTSVPCIYAGTNNTLTIKANTTKAGKYLVKLFADAAPVASVEVELDGTEKTFSLTDPTIRPIDENTVNGANNDKVAYEIEFSLDGIYVNSDYKIVPVLYNGNLGYDLEYGDVGFEEFKYLIDGDVVIDVKDVSSYLGASAMNRTDVWTVNVPDNSSLKKALLLIPYNWFNAKLYNETADMFDVTFNGETVAPSLFYRDQGNLGNYGQYGYGVVVYDVQKLLNVSGENTLVLNKKYPTPAVYPSTLIYAYNTPKGTFKEFSFTLGADLLSNANNVAGRTVKSDTELNIVGLHCVNATLYVLAAGAQAGEGNIIFNGVEFVDVWSGTSSTTDLFTADVTGIINETNDVSFVATGSTILSLAQFVVVDTGVYFEIDSIKTEYTSTPCVYAGTNNTLTVTVSSSTSDNFTACLYADGELVSEINVTLINGTNDILITDPTIRPINETTVNGANNTKVKYEVRIIKDHMAYKRSITVPVLYNGYLGKDFEYDESYIAEYYIITVNGGYMVDIQDDSTYMAGAATNRTDVWDIGLGEDDSLDTAFVYIAYNWDKTPGVAGPELNVTFNGNVIVPMIHCRDQSNLGGASGKYGYGLYVYDVSDFIKKGNNTLVLNKPSGLTAVYPSCLMYFYNCEGSNVQTTAYIAHGADLISNSYNNAGRLVKTDSIIFDINSLNLLDADLLVFAAGAQAGEGNIVFNGVEDVNVWNGSSYSYDCYYKNIDGNVKWSNDVSFVGTGSTILALQQMIVTYKEIINAEVSFKTEYTDTCYAGTNNTVTVTAKSDKNGTYVVELLADGNVVDSMDVDLYEGVFQTTFKLTDPTIRPIDETTVNGADNTLVQYEVDLKYNGEVVASYMDVVPVLYNGYLGKDLEYDATYIEDCTVISGNFIDIIALDDSTYMAGAATNRTDIFGIDLSESCSLNSAFVYIAYNWDKTAGVAGPVLNVTFNGNDIVPKAHYRDQSNLGGASAKYGYGLYVYDVSGLIQIGNNTLVLNKESGKTAVYPSVLVYSCDVPGIDYIYTAYIFDGADLISNSYNNAGRIVKTDSQLNITSKDESNAYLIVFAASDEPGEGNIVVNGVEHANVCNGTSKSYDFYIVDIDDIVKESNEVSFVGTGSTILALQQMIVTIERVTADVSLATEYSNTCYAGTNNTITATVNSKYAGKYCVELLADGVVVDSCEVDLDGVNEVTLLLTDPTIRAIDETTVNGANNTNVEYTVNVRYNEAFINSASKTVPVLYNGYLGKDLEYNATYIEDCTVITVNGPFIIDSLDDSSYMALADTNRTDVWAVDLIEGDSLECAFVYIAYNWDKTAGVAGPVLNVTFNGNDIVPKAHYRDQSNLGGASAKYGYGLFVYDVSGLIQNGNNTLVLNKEKGLTAVYPSTLLYAINREGYSDFSTAYIFDGVDLLYNNYNDAGRLVKTDSQLNITTKDILEAGLVVFAAGGQPGEGNIVFNGVEYADVWNGTSYSYDLYSIDIADSIKDSNDVSFVSTGGTIVALQQILFTSTMITADVSLATEYSNTCFAGTDNAITVKVISNYEGLYTVELLADGVVVDSGNVYVYDGIQTSVILTDPTIRPIDETTVNGANNTNVEYTVNVKFNGASINTTSKTVPVLYNGYLGKDLEYNANYIEDYTVITVTGGILVDIQEDSTYMAGGDTNRTDIWNVNLDSASSLDSAFVYIAYNWDKTTGVAGPELNVTFNGNDIVPKAHYRDQSNLGTSGRYGYGLYVYDVSGLIKNGDNTLVLNKPSGPTAVYPSTLIYFYNTLNSDLLTTAYIADGADLISNSYNNAGRLVKTDSQLNITSKDIIDSELWVFAASAQAGEGNIVFNGVEDVNVWNGSSKSYDLYYKDIASSLKDSNDVSFVGTGSTILALQQMIVTSQKAPVTLTPKALTTTYDSGKAFTVTVNDAKGKPVSGLKLDMTVYTNGKATVYQATTNANGVASLASASKLAIGTHKVVVSSSTTKYVVSKATSSIKVSKAKTTVKAPKVTAKVNKNKYFKVTVKNKATKKVVKNIKVKVKVYTGKNSKTYVIKTNSKGVAKLNTKNLKVGTHKVVITSGNSKYIISAKSSIVIKK